MDASEALEKIREIHQTIEGSNKALFSSERIITAGILSLLIPLIEWTTTALTFGNASIARSPSAIILIHIAFYVGLFALVFRLLPYRKPDRTAMHPLIQKAFNIRKQFWVALFGIMFSLVAAGQGQLVYPMIFILLGFLYTVYGRFAIPAVSYIAWSYIVVGIVYAYLTRFGYANLWMAFVIYQGLSLIAMGAFLMKEKTRQA